MSTASEFSVPLVKRFKAAGVAFEEDGGQLRIPARLADVGDLLIAFDDGEITVYVGNFTHCHFTLYQGSDTYAERTAKDCVEHAPGYICGILNDQWVLWSYPGGSGGSYRLGAEDDPMEDAPLLGEGVIRYVWYGPCDARPNK